MMATYTSAGFNVETIKYKGVHFTTWDVSGKSVSAFLGNAHFVIHLLLKERSYDNRTRALKCKTLGVECK